MSTEHGSPQPATQPHPMDTISQRASFIERRTCINCGGDTIVELSAGTFDAGAVGRFIEADPWGEHPAIFLSGRPWAYQGCTSCGMAFHRYILDAVWNERRFARWMSQEAIEAFERPHKTPANTFRRAAEYTAHVLQLEQLTRGIRGGAPVRLLDFGCGYGEFLAMCGQYGFEAFGVDRSEAKRENGESAKVFASIEDVADRAPFHALTLFEVAEHLDDPRAVLGTLRHLVAPGGILVLETPDCTGVTRIDTRDDYDRIHPLEHINGFTPATMRDFAARLGFEAIAKPVASVTCDPARKLRSIAKDVLKPFLKPTTQMYFRKV